MSTRRRWEYQTVELSNHVGMLTGDAVVDDAGMAALSDAGAQGWEIVAVVHRSGTGHKHALMKREVVDE